MENRNPESYYARNRANIQIVEIEEIVAVEEAQIGELIIPTIIGQTMTMSHSKRKRDGTYVRIAKEKVGTEKKNVIKIQEIKIETIVIKTEKIVQKLSRIPKEMVKLLRQKDSSKEKRLI